MPREAFIEGKRIADEAIYLNEDRRGQTKNKFVEMGIKIRELLNLSNTKDISLLDVGCATGDFLHYMSNELDHIDFYGLDVNRALLDEAKNRLNFCQFKQGDVCKNDLYDKNTFDIVTMSGVLNCLDDPAPALESVIKWLKPGGLIVILDMVNEYDVDIVMRHRRVTTDYGEWEKGWNYFSKKTFELILSEYQEISWFKFQPFKMDKSIAKREDPLRTWTEPFKDNPYQLVNGANQLINNHILCIQKVKKL